MIIFLPFPEVIPSLQVLDDARLGKQRLEIYQIYQILTSDKPANHPAVRMVLDPIDRERYLGFVIYYHNECLNEWISRGKNNNMKKLKYQRSDGSKITEIEYPWYMGWKEFHLTHQASLFRKHPYYYLKKFPDLSPFFLERGYIWPSKVTPHPNESESREEYYAEINHATSKNQEKSFYNLYTKQDLIELAHFHKISFSHKNNKQEIYNLLEEKGIIEFPSHPLLDFLFQLKK